MPCFANIKSVVRADNLATKKTYLYLLRCKLWSCEYCGHINKLQWVAKISNGLEVYAQQDITDWKFITLTSHSKLRNQAQCLYAAPDAWKKLSARIRYHYPGIKYVKIPELHKKGKVHWHMLASGGITTPWIKKTAPKCGYGYMCESENVRDGYHSVLYISKELSKQLGLNSWPKGLRRIATSQKWPELPSDDDFDENELDWHYVGEHDESELKLLVRKTELLTGHEVILVGTDTKYEEI